MEEEWGGQASRVCSARHQGLLQKESPPHHQERPGQGHSDPTWCTYQDSLHFIYFCFLVGFWKISLCISSYRCNTCPLQIASLLGYVPSFPLLRSNHSSQLGGCLFRQLAIHAWDPNGSQASMQGSLWAMQIPGPCPRPCGWMKTVSECQMLISRCPFKFSLKFFKIVKVFGETCRAVHRTVSEESSPVTGKH